MDNYIELNRKFRVPDDGDDSYGRSFDLFSWGDKSWADLLEIPRVVIHARAGFGKSEEMRHIAQKLFQEGKSAFYIKLEDLKSDRLNDYFLNEQAERFEHWLSADSDPAWLFLDSVDELKLTNTKLEQALRNVTRAIPSSKQADIHIYLSSRPSDWSNHVEQPAFEKLLPVVPKSLDKDETLHREQLYLEVLSGNWQGKPVEEDLEKPKVQYFNLMGLSRDQVKVYVEAKLGHQAQDFLTLLNREYAWYLAECPMDLDGLIAYWRKKGALGTSLEQYRHLCEERLAETTFGRNEVRRLSPDRVLMGAEKLALSLVLTQTGSSVFFAGYTDGSVDILSAQAVLSDWPDPEVKELLRSALFDPATHDCVQFAHRSMREYLAAQCLKRLLGNNLSFPSLKSELFKQQYGEQVIPHSLKPIVAWLSVLDERFFDLAVDNFPEVLMSDGAPDSYRLEQKQRLITSFAKKYATHERVMNIPLEFAARLAEPALAATLNNLWSQYDECPDFRELTLELIEAGKITDCVDIMYAVAKDKNMPASHISQAIYGLKVCSATTKLAELARQIVNQPNQFASSVITHSLPVFYPDHISTGELVTLVKALNIPASDSHDRISLVQILQNIANTIAPLSNQGIELRSALAKLIFEATDKESSSWGPNSHYAYVSSALLIICFRQLTRHITLDRAFLWDCMIANKYRTERYVSRYTKVDGVPLDEVKVDASLHRKEAFMTEVEFALTFPEEDCRDIYLNFIGATAYSLIAPLIPEDWCWLTDIIRENTDDTLKEVAVWALDGIWLDTEESTFDKSSIESFADELNLKETYPFLFQIAEESPKWRHRQEQLRIKDQETAQQKYEEQQHDIAWRTNLLRTPTLIPESYSNLSRIRDWLKVYESSGDDAVWNKSALADAFSEEVANVAEQAFQNIWKGEHLLFRSERNHDSYFKLTDREKTARTGLYITAQSNGWELGLTTQDVEKAVRLILTDLGSFNLALETLYQTHAQQVEALIANEAVAQLALITEHPDLSLIAGLCKLPDVIVSSIVAKCLPYLEHFIEQEKTVYWMGNDNVIRLFSFIARSEQADQHQQAVTLCCKWLTHHLDIYLENTLLKSLLKLDNKEALRQLTNRLRDYQTTDSERALKVLSGLFGHHDFAFKRNQLPDLIDELSELLILAYQLVLPHEDISYKGTYTPDLRDNAQTARSFLLSSLINTPCAATYQALQNLSELPEFTHIQQQMKIWARNRAATDTEERKFSLDEIKRSFIAKEFIPNDRDSLYEAVLNKLNEVEHYLKTNDFSLIQFWKCAEVEQPIQLLLADRLEERRNQLFSIERETEVHNRKRTDIRVTAQNTDVKAVIEIKHGNQGYSLADLEKTLEIQIVGQYLCSAQCRAGVLFITYHREKKWVFDGKKRSFSELIEKLKLKAKALEKQHNYEFRLGVFGLDLTEV